MDLTSLEVKDRTSFITFPNLLQHDLLNNKAEGENKTLEDFLDAFSRYTQYLQGYYYNSNQPINADIASRTVFADLFKVVKVYEYFYSHFRSGVPTLYKAGSRAAM